MAKLKEVIFKIVVSDPKTGKAIQKEVKGDDTRLLIGKKIGDIINGEIIGLEGYKLQITGGSDFAGFPMRKEIEGTGKKRVWVWIDKRTRVKRLVRGNTIHEQIVQINTKIVEYGNKSFEEIYNEIKGGEQAAQ